jgi:hypothetical protein
MKRVNVALGIFDFRNRRHENKEQEPWKRGTGADEER